MANERNLKPFNTMPPDVQRELSRRGGLASGAARRAKRDRIIELAIEKQADILALSDLTAMLREEMRSIATARR